MAASALPSANVTNMSPERAPKRRPPQADTTRRYFGMTQEQREWNEAIDAKKKGQA